MNTKKDTTSPFQSNLLAEELQQLKKNQELLVKDLDNKILKVIEDVQVQIFKIQDDSNKKQAIKDETMKNLKLFVDDLSLFNDASLQKKTLDNILRLICEKFTIVESRIKSLETTQDFLMEDVMNMTERVNKLTDKIELIEKELEKIKLVDLILMVKTFIEKQE